MLEIRGLSKRYGDIVAADDVDLAVSPGRMVGFVGPNGAGKSTTMRSCMGLVAPDAGSISWNGTPLDLGVLRRTGYLPEQRGLYPKMKIGDQVAYFAQLKGMDRHAAKASAADLLGDLGLGDRLGDPLEKLSHGNQQRVQLAVALVNDPVLLILDEPFNGLDPVAAETLHAVLRQRVADGVAVLFSSHQLDLVERTCDELVVIAEGKVRAAGTIDGVRTERGRHRAVVRVDRPLMPLADALADFVLIEHSTRSAVVDIEEEQLGRLMTAARTAGPLLEFRYELPSLGELFADLVDTTDDPSVAAAAIDTAPELIQ